MQTWSIYFCIISWTNSLSVGKVSIRLAKRAEGMHTVDASVTVLVGLPNHLIDLVVGQLLADGRHDVSQLSSGDEAVVITVEDLESLYSHKNTRQKPLS
jgi:hypothetical protein